MLQVFAEYGRSGPSARVRVHQWLERVAVDHRLHEYAGKSTASASTLLSHPAATLRGELILRRARVRSSDVTLVHRAATPLGRGAAEAQLLRDAELGVFDFDDALQWEPLLPGLGRRLFPRAISAITSVLAADRVIAGNATLADWASAHNPDVRVIPSCVEPGFYIRKRDYVLSDPPLIGWIGSASTERYLDAIADALLHVHRRTGALLVIVGAASDRQSPLAAMTRRIRWTEARVHNHAGDWDVGIMPLADRLYERGKCGYKLLQYGAAGLPMVGSPVGVNGGILSRIGAPCPGTTDEWIDALLGVLDSPMAERAAMGARARCLVEREYSYAAWQDQWVDAIGGPSAQPAMAR